MIIHKVIELRKDKPIKFCTERRLKVTRVFFKKAKCASYFDGFVTCKRCLALLKKEKQKRARPVPKNRHKDTKVARKTAANSRSPKQRKLTKD
jgi:hypothetical protein